MKILPEQAISPSIDAGTNSGARAAKSKLGTQSDAPETVEKASSAGSTPRVVPAQPETDITFRRDQNGRIFYIVTDAKSGKELQEIPPRQVRSVGQGIADICRKKRRPRRPRSWK